MPTLNWIGKDKVVTHDQEVPYHTLKRVYSFDKDGQKAEDNGSENMIIHGDNLVALKALLPQYEGKVKCIYIDPPYNTGEEGWVYNDNVNDPAIQRWLNKVVGVEGEDFSRHDKWLCMMYPRLALLQKLLHKKDGVIFISIDDNEYANLKLLCNEIFGSNKHVATIVWQKRYSRENREAIGDVHDYILVYACDPKTFKERRHPVPMNEAQAAVYKNPNNDPKGRWRPVPLTGQAGHATKSQFFPITSPSGKVFYPPTGRCWALSEATFNKLNEEGRIYFGKNGDSQPNLIRYLSEVPGVAPWTWWPQEEAGNNDEAKKEIITIFGNADAFDTPKPYRLLRRILQIATDKDDLILDSFAGAGTTAHAVLALNNQDGGHRRFICIEMMPYADTVTAERVKRVIKGYKADAAQKVSVYDKELKAKDLKEGKNLFEEAQQAQADAKASGEWDTVSAPKLVDNHLQVIATKKATGEVVGTGGDFSFYELGNQILTDEGAFDASLSVEEIKAFIWQSETHTPYQPLSDGDDGCLGVFNGTAIYAFYDRNEERCFDLDALRSMKHRAEAYVVYAAASLFPEEDLDRKNITFKKVPRDVANK